jgi:hypothetical protein
MPNAIPRMSMVPPPSVAGFAARLKAAFRPPRRTFGRRPLGVISIASQKLQMHPISQLRRERPAAAGDPAREAETAAEDLAGTDPEDQP